VLRRALKKTGRGHILSSKQSAGESRGKGVTQHIPVTVKSKYAFRRSNTEVRKREGRVLVVRREVDLK
jgi:hypothetical protein